MDLLESLRERGGVLFQPSRERLVDPWLYPVALRTRLEPSRFRGAWTLGTGPFPNIPLVRSAFSSPVAATLSLLSISSDGSECCRNDVFDDGTIALTLGENAVNRGVLLETLGRAQRLDDDEPLGSHYVNVLAREDFSHPCSVFPVPGERISFTPVPCLRQVAICAGDVRALMDRLLRAARLNFDSLETAWAAPFDGPSRDGGDLQYDDRTGAVSPRHRRPSPADAARALDLSRRRGEAWLEQFGREAASSESVSRPWRGKRVDPRLAKVLDFIEQHIERRVSVSELADVAGLRRSAFHDLFRRSMGRPPLDYVAERRLDRAERLLRTTHLSVGEISAACGFSEPTSLTHSLTKRKGLTPSMVRRRAAIER